MEVLGGAHPAPSRARLACLAAAFTVAVGMAPPRTLAEVADDVQVKVAFLYSFARYTRWPPEAGAGRPEAFTIAVLGTDPFGPTLEAMLRGRTVDGRTVVIRRITRLEDVQDAQILYIGDSEAERLPRILERLEGAAVLTVGEMSRFAERGGVIRLRREGRRFRLEINVGAAGRARLTISSELLKLARIVHENRPD